MDEILAYLKANPTYHLATVDAEGNPQVRPFGTIALINGKLYIQTGKSKDVYKELAAHPRAALSVFDNAGTWLRIEADFINDDSREAKVALLNEYPSLQAMYSADDDNTAVLYMENAKASFCSFTAAPRVIEF